MQGFVYRWYDKSNGKLYVGSHKGAPDDGYLGGGTLFIRAYNKRPDSFVREILYQGENYRELEQLILDLEDAANNNNYYNLVNKAWGGSGYGEVNPFYGKKHSQKTKAELSKKRKGKKCSKELKRKMALVKTKYYIYCGVNGKSYQTQDDCALDLSISKNTIWWYLNGKRTNKYKLKKIPKTKSEEIV